MSRVVAPNVEAHETVPVEVDQVRVLLPRDVVDQIRAYDHDLAWTIRRALAHLVEEEDRQAAALAAQKRRPPGRQRRAA
jgi:hypothetical protein